MSVNVFFFFFLFFFFPLSPCSMPRCSNVFFDSATIQSGDSFVPTNRSATVSASPSIVAAYNVVSLLLPHPCV